MEPILKGTFKINEARQKKKVLFSLDRCSQTTWIKTTKFTTKIGKIKIYSESK